MFEFLKKWFQEDSGRPAAKAPKARYRPVPQPKKPVKRPPPAVRVDTSAGGRVEDGGPGKNVWVRTRYQREDTGTHETLQIIDDDVLNTPDEDGIDPYNTGKYDRSKHWDKRFRN